MTGEAEDLIHGHLDGTLSPGDEAALNAWLTADPANARVFAAVSLLHDRLRDVAASGSEGGAVRPAPAARPRPAGAGRRSPRWRATAVVSLAVAAAGVLVVWLSPPAPLSAAAELDRLIDAPAPAGDRTYLITGRDYRPDAGDPKQPPLDGAVLHVRNPDKYVLVRRFPDGRPFITGSDGERGWSIRPDGPVRVSGDPLRFRGPLPGNQHGIPFIDPRSDLLQLRDAYGVSTLPAAADGLGGLAFEKKSQEYRGPRRVEAWYDPGTRVVHRMEF
ncbi:MAG: anti-sigma factor family protein, partial [Gemmata sp.]